MTIEYAAHGISNRLIMIITIDQDREQAGNRPGHCAVCKPGAGSCPLQQLGQFAKHGWGIALGGRGLACRQPDLALGHGKAGDRIHQAQDF